MKIKKILKFILDEFIYGGHLLSLGAFAILLTATILFDQKINIFFLLLGYTMSQIVYFYDHYKELKKDSLTNFKRARHIEKFKAYFPIIFTSYWIFFIFILIYLNNLNVVFLSLFIIAGGLLYTKFFKNLSKKIIGFKNFYVSFFWALLVILTGVYYYIPFNISLILLLLFIFLRILVNNIFFDIKDIESDKKNGLKTFPIILGKKKTLNYIHILNFVSFSPLIFGIWNNFFPFFSLWLIFFYFYTFYYLEKVKKMEFNIYFLFILADGEYLFWFFILLLGKFITNLQV